jgi:hypothetical protein
MKLKCWLAVMTAATALGLVAMPAQAAPAGGISALKAADAPAADVQKAGGWHGRRYGYRPYYGYGPRFHNGPRYGYRYRYRPGFRFYFGPRYNRRHWGYRHW